MVFGLSSMYGDRVQTGRGATSPALMQSSSTRSAHIWMNLLCASGTLRLKLSSKTTVPRFSAGFHLS